MIWFTVQLDDKPGALARMAAALGERGINITAIVGIAEDTDGALMLATSDAGGTREAFKSLKLAFEEHDPEAGLSLDEMSRATGLADRGMGGGSR
ncbi:MAG: ACT domain-containing protein [Candidatus Limnocylindrales bacterium]